MQSQLFETESPVAGVDEAGRGPLAGPVVAAAVILDPARPIAGLADSKALSAQRRETLACEIRQSALTWSVGWADRAEIDALNILAATMLAMRRAIIGLRLVPATVLVDGNRLPNLHFNGRYVEGIKHRTHARVLLIAVVHMPAQLLRRQFVAVFGRTEKVVDARGFRFVRQEGLVFELAELSAECRKLVFIKFLVAVSEAEATSSSSTWSQSQGLEHLLVRALTRSRSSQGHSKARRERIGHGGFNPS